MSGKSLFSKLAILALLAVNVGAYYAFWPENSPMPFFDEPVAHAAPEKQEVAAIEEPRRSPTLGTPDASVAPIKDDAVKGVEPAPATELPAKLVTLPQPKLEVTAAPAVATTPLSDEDAKQKEMLAQLREAVAQTAKVDAPPAAATELEGPPPAADALPQSVKTTRGSWTLEVSAIGARQMLRARHAEGPTLNVLSDRVDLGSDTKAPHAVGNVTVTGPGLTGGCQQLTLADHDLVLNGKAEVRIHDVPVDVNGTMDRRGQQNLPEERPGWEMRGDVLNVRLTGSNVPRPPSATIERHIFPSNVDNRN